MINLENYKNNRLKLLLLLQKSDEKNQNKFIVKKNKTKRKDL